jgi:hypothetical protein
VRQRMWTLKLKDDRDVASQGMRDTPRQATPCDFTRGFSAGSISFLFRATPRENLSDPLAPVLDIALPTFAVPVSAVGTWRRVCLPRVPTGCGTSDRAESHPSVRQQGHTEPTAPVRGEGLNQGRACALAP